MLLARQTVTLQDQEQKISNLKVALDTNRTIGAAVVATTQGLFGDFLDVPGAAMHSG